MPTQTEKNTANEEHFDSCFRWCKMYMWKDKCNIYTTDNDGKIKPQTMKGYIEIANAVGKDWFLARVAFPDVPSPAPEKEILAWLCEENDAWIVEPKKVKKTRRGGKKHKKK